LRDKLGESRTTGPENPPAETISTATFAPRLTDDDVAGEIRSEPRCER
jgi:hypothetical protein